MNKFTKQWNILDNAVNTSPIIPNDYAGFRSFYQYHLVVPYHFYYALDLLMQENSKLRRKLHESKQRAKSWHLRYDSEVEINNKLMDSVNDLTKTIRDIPIETNGTHWFRQMCRDYPMKAKQIMCLYGTCETCPLHKTSCITKTFVQEALLARYRKEY